MADILIKNMELPKDGSIHIRINSEGNVDIYGEYCSHLGMLVDCKAIPIRKELCEVFAKKCNDYDDDAFDKESAIEVFRDTLLEVGIWTY